eukprot:scaffold338_cov155-Skeletonema_menzelii.AAC.6
MFGRSGSTRRVVLAYAVHQVFLTCEVLSKTSSTMKLDNCACAWLGRLWMEDGKTKLSLQVESQNPEI